MQSAVKQLPRIAGNPTRFPVFPHLDETRKVIAWALCIDSRRPKESSMANTKKCAHPNCSCQISEGKYCSAACEAVEETPDIDCRCNHPGCKGRAH